ASMSLQKAMHFFGQFWSDAFGSRDLLDARFAQAIDRTKFSKEQVFRVLAYARTIVQDAFVDPLLEQKLVISIGEAMRFVSNSLEQMQRAGIGRQLQRHRATRPVNFLMLLRQTDNRQIVQPQSLQFTTGRGELSFATVDDDQVRQTNSHKLALVFIGYAIQCVCRILL